MLGLFGYDVGASGCDDGAFGYALGARWLRCWGFLDMMVGRLDAMLGRFGYDVEAFAYDVRVVWMRSWGFWDAMRGSLEYEVGAFWGTMLGLFFSDVCAFVQATINDSQPAAQRNRPRVQLRREQLRCPTRVRPQCGLQLARERRDCARFAHVARTRPVEPRTHGEISRTFAHNRAAAVKNRRKRTVYTSRFVRVILAQGPC